MHYCNLKKYHVEKRYKTNIITFQSFIVFSHIVSAYFFKVLVRMVKLVSLATNLQPVQLQKNPHTVKTEEETF